jgi:AbiV family abortive infection protein
MTFRIKLDQVIDLMDACIQNAEALHGASESLLASGHVPGSAALSILALEELGKSIICDGLAVARQGSGKAQRFDRKRADHQTKLLYVDHLHLFLQVIAILDDDFTKATFQEELDRMLDKWYRTKQQFERVAQENKLRDINTIKQSAFYVGLSAEGKIEQPNHAISASLAEALGNYVHQSVSAVSFLWKRNRQRYRSVWEKARKLDPKDYEAVVASVRNLFGTTLD